MKMKKILTILLAVLMMFSTFSSMLIIDVSATESIDGHLSYIYEKDDKGKDTTDVDYESTVMQYFTEEFATPQDKLASMQLYFQQDGFQLYVDTVTGEVATVNIESGEILFSNPYDVANSNTKSDSVKGQIMSQIIIKYTDNDTEKYFYSCEQAAMNGQITIENIKNGIRVEYTIGREETKMLVPRMISKTRFEEMIIAPAAAALPNAADGTDNFLLKKLKAYYLLKDLSTCSTAREAADLTAAFPITSKMAVYVFDPNASTKELTVVEELIKTYCPLYTYEEMDKDHAETEYEGSDRAPALFKLALEYSLDEWGMSVRLPANGIRFNETEYQLTFISILPFMGAGGTNGNTGYNFFPDGSGTLFRFEDLAGVGTTINGKVYGQDYAYHTITGTNQEIIRYPVFGIVENWEGEKTVDTDVVATPAVYDSVTGALLSETVYKTEVVETQEDRGFVAIIEEGDALAELSTYHMGTMSDYNTVQMLFYPRPKDSFNLSDAISVGSNSTWTVVSSRKYVGNYKIRYIMLTDEDLAAEKGITDYYDTTWEGMAHAYQDYLVSEGTLTRLTEDDVKEDIPLYIETFGSMITVEKILSIPVNVMTPMTTFEDIQTIYKELSEEGIDNIDFKMTGYYNGGMYATVPYYLKWESSVGGSSGFEELVADAKENDYGIYPDFDFVYAHKNVAFDGLNFKDYAVKTINNQYTVRRVYSAMYQDYVGYFDVALSPAYFEHFITKFADNYMEYNPVGISVSTLGSDLNSDFDEDEPYNREDSKQFTIDSLEQIANLKNSDGEGLSIMTDKGNAFTWKYVDHILNIPLDSSRYIKSSNSVPFIGIVLHGYIQFAGTPYNMEGDTAYALLKAIENGAGLYFILSYQNTDILKDYEKLSNYYSIRYDIWKEDLVENYNELNDLLSDLQTKLIITHDFLVGERVPDPDEILSDEEAAKIAEELEQAEQAVIEAQEALAAALTARTEPAKQAQIAAEAAMSAAEQAIIAAKAADKITSADVLGATDAFDLKLIAISAVDAAKAVVTATGATMTTTNLTNLVNSITAERTAYNAATTAGVTKTQLDNSIQLYIDYKTAEANEVSAASVKSRASSSWSSLRSQAISSRNNYYTALETLAKDGVSTDISNAIALIITYNKEEALALDYEYLASLTDATDAQKTVATTQRTKANTAKDSMNAVDATVLASANTEVNSAIADVNAAIPLISDYSAKKAISEASGATDAQKAATAAAKLLADAISTNVDYAADMKISADAKLVDCQASEAAYNVAVSNYNVALTAKTDANTLLEADPLKVILADASTVATSAAQAAIDANVATAAQISTAVTKRANLVAKELAYQNALTAQATAEADADDAEAALTSPLGVTSAEIAAATTARAKAETAKTATETAKTNRDNAQAEVDALNITAGLYLDAVIAKEQENTVTSQSALVTTASTTAYTTITKKNVFTSAIDEIYALAIATVDYNEANAYFVSVTNTLSALVTLADSAIIIADKAATTAQLAADAAQLNADITADLINNNPNINLPTEIITDTAALALQAKTYADETAISAALAQQGTEVLPFMQAKVLLFADSTSRSAITSIETSLTQTGGINTLYTTISNAVQTLTELKSKASAATIDLKAANNLYAVAMGKFLDATSTDEEKSAAKVDIINAYVRIITAQKAIDLYQSEYTRLSSTRNSLVSLTTKAATVVTNAEIAITNTEYAKLLLDELMADSTTDPIMLTKAQEAYDNLKALSDKASAYAQTVTNYVEIATEGLDKVLPVTETTTTTTTTEETTTKYTSDDGRIVMVTYGGKDGDDSAPYRSFILNYNAFQVTTVVNNVEYTVDAFGYVVIDY